MPRYVLGSELPERLRKLAKRKDTRRFTGEHRPRWLDSPSIDIARRNGPPDFKDDAEWLAHTEFPVSGKGDQLHLAKNGQQPRTHYLPKPEPSGDAPIELFLQPPPKFAPPPRAPRYMRGSSLPQDLQEQAKLTKAGQARYPSVDRLFNRLAGVQGVSEQPRFHRGLASRLIREDGEASVRSRGTMSLREGVELHVAGVVIPPAPRTSYDWLPPRGSLVNCIKRG